MQRIISAAVGLPLFVALLFLAGHSLFRGVLLVLLLVALWEYLRLAATATALAAVALAGGAASLWLTSAGSGPDAAGLALIALLAASLWSVRDPVKRFHGTAEAALGMMYLTYAFSCLLLLRALPHGASWTLIVMAIVWAGDTAAYYGGRRFGRRRMAPLLSPKKTWEGAASGLCASIAAGLFLTLILPVSATAGETFLIAAVVGICGQLGDLIVSLWKRAKGVKDSGRIIPGHGGLLDRIDGLLLGVPVGYNIVRTWVV